MNRVLVVEDDPSALKLVEYTLQQEGYKVTVASNGLEGLQKAQTEPIDLAILDLMLPGMDGFEICHRLRQDSLTADLPILVLSAKTHESDTAMAIEVGADAYLTKPADPSRIVSEVQRLLSQSPRLI